MSTIDDVKKRGRGRPPVDTQAITLRISRADLATLDTFIASEPDPKPTRPEAIRRIVAERLQPATEKSVAPSARTIAARGAKVRSDAADAADHAMTGMEGTPEVKAQRRRALTNEPAAVAKARAKRTARE